MGGSNYINVTSNDQYLAQMYMYIKNMRQFNLGFRMKFKTLFMSDHDFLLFFNMSKQLLAPGGLNAECVQVRIM